jgi:hypothetical protein
LGESAVRLPVQTALTFVHAKEAVLLALTR